LSWREKSDTTTTTCIRIALLRSGNTVDRPIIFRFSLEIIKNFETLSVACLCEI
jgi:hypothetical protein